LLLRQWRAAARHADSEKIVDDQKQSNDRGEAREYAENQTRADGNLADHHQITEKLVVRDDVTLEKMFVPGIYVEAGNVTDLAPDPISFREIPQKFSDSLLEQVVADVDPQYADIPKVGPFFEIHFSSRVTECWPIPVVVRERIVAALKTTVRNISNIALTTANDQASKVSPNPEKK